MSDTPGPTDNALSTAQREAAEWKARATAAQHGLETLKQKAQLLKEKAQLAVDTNKALKNTALQYQKRAEDLQQMCFALNTDKNELQKKLTEAVAEAQSNQLRVSTVEQQLALYQSALTEVRGRPTTPGDVEAEKRVQEEMQERLEAVESSLRQAEERVTFLESECASKDEEIRNLGLELTQLLELQTALEESDLRWTQKQEEARTLQVEVNRLTEECERLSLEAGSATESFEGRLSQETATWEQRLQALEDEHRGELEESKAQGKDVELQLEEVRGALQEALVENEARTGEVDALLSELGTLTHEFKVEREHLFAECEKLAQQNSALESQREGDLAELEEARRTIAQLGAALNDKQVENEEHLQEIEALKKEIEDFAYESEGEKETLLQECERLSTQKDEMEERFREELAQIEEQKSQALIEAEHAREQVAELEATLQVARESSEADEREIEALQKEIEDYVESSTGEKVDLLQNFEQVSARKAELERRVRELESALAQATERADAHEQEVEAIQKEMEDFAYESEGEKETLLQECERVSTQKDEIEQRLAEAQAEHARKIEEMRATLAQVTEQAKGHEQEVEALKKEIEDFAYESEGEKETLLQECERLSAQKDELEQALENLRTGEDVISSQSNESGKALEASREESAVARAEAEALKNELENFAEEFAQERQTFIDELETRGREMSSLEEKYANVVMQLQEAESKRLELSSQYEKLQRGSEHSAALQEKLEAAEARLKATDTRLREALERSTVASASESRLKSELESEQVLTERLREEVRRVTGEQKERVQIVENQLFCSKAQREELEKKLADLEREKAALQNQMTQARVASTSGADTLKEELERAIKEKSTAEGKLAAVATKLLSTQTQLEKLQREQNGPTV